VDFQEFRFRGRHAEEVQFLCTERGQKRDNSVNLFRRVIDVYMVAAIMGLRYGRKENVDDSNMSASSTVPQSAMNTESQNLDFLYRLILLLDRSEGLSEEERIDRAFKSDTDKRAVEKNMELFNSYVRGGVDVLYEQFSKDADSIGDLMIDYLNFID
jgi:hypothetical protein